MEIKSFARSLFYHIIRFLWEIKWHGRLWDWSDDKNSSTTIQSTISSTILPSHIIQSTISPLYYLMLVNLGLLKVKSHFWIFLTISLSVYLSWDDEMISEMRDERWLMVDDEFFYYSCLTIYHLISWYLSHNLPCHLISLPEEGHLWDK